MSTISDLMPPLEVDMQLGSSARSVHLPLAACDKCSHCGQSGEGTKLRWCSSCAEILYCSSNCQEADWKAHKKNCWTNGTDRIDLLSYFPFIASLNFALQNKREVDHLALKHQIVNSPDSEDEMILPGGERATLVRLGRALPKSKVGTPEWWPAATNCEVREQIRCRIHGQGPVLPVLVAICFCLVSEMYTTTSSRSSKTRHGNNRRIRLSYNGNPIADFGIVHGSAPITPRTRLVYQSVGDRTLKMGQDPHDHYWMYFTTLAGEEYYLDCNAYTLNMFFSVHVEEYSKPEYGLPEETLVPAIFLPRDWATMPLSIGVPQYKPRKRFSMLREPRLMDLIGEEQAISGYSNSRDLPTIFNIMKDISGHECSDVEKNLTSTFLPMASLIVRYNMQTRNYMKFPEDSLMSCGQTCSVLQPPNLFNDGKVPEFMKKLIRKLKNGKITVDQWDQAICSWLQTMAL